jgi:hypothetical protein
MVTMQSNGRRPMMAEKTLHVAVVDIGRVTNLEWVVEGPSVVKSGSDIDKCIEALARALRRFPKGGKERASFESDAGEPSTQNLLDAMPLRLGWTDDLTVLSEPSLVVRCRGDSN